MKQEQRIKLTNVIKGLQAKQSGGVLLALAIIVVVASLVSPYFLTVYNMQAVVRSLAFVALVAIGQACLLIIGELDLSVGAIAGLCGVVGGMLMVQAGVNPYLSFTLCLLLGMAFGFINGIIIAGLNLNSMVVTIGMTGVYTGINLVLSEGKAITGIPEAIYFLGQGEIFNVPMPFVIMGVVLAIILFITKLTPFGRYMYAIGNSRQASQILGIKVNAIRVITFMIAGLLSALAGMVMVARLGSSQPSIGDSWVLSSIAAPVIGGVASTGGLGSPAGALLGAAIIGVIENIIVLFGISPYWQTVVSGTIVVGAIALDSISRMIMSKKNG
ncbi:MAG TPA: ABC transporter permease [Bacillota bacterium]|nr:ABC transporter permease [Bacillota bacterium]